MKKTLDVVIPSRGEMNRLKNLLASFASADLQCVDSIYIAFNGTAFPEGFQKNYPHLPLKIMGCPQVGVNNARKWGWQAAKSPLILFLDDDCELVDKNFFNDHVASHGQSPHAIAIGGPYLQAPSPSMWSETYALIQEFWLYSGFKPDGFNPNLLGGNISYKKSLAGDNCFDPAIRFGGSETEFNYRLVQLGHTLLMVEKMRVRHHVTLGFWGFANRAFYQGLHCGRYGFFSQPEATVTKNELFYLRTLHSQKSYRWAAFIYRQIFNSAKIWGLPHLTAPRRTFLIALYFVKMIRKEIFNQFKSLADRIELFILAHDRKTDENGTSSIDLNKSK